MLIVHADGWAQVPKLTVARKGFTDLNAALREAKRILTTGDDNARDTVRVYPRPTAPAFLRERDALAAIRLVDRKVQITITAAGRAHLDRVRAGSLLSGGSLLPTD